MEDFIFRVVERFGFTTAMVVVMTVAISRLFNRNQVTEQKLESLQAATTKAVTDNTEATKSLTETLKKSIGSGPVCKANEGCQAEKAGERIVAELQRMNMDRGLTSDQIMKVVNAVKDRKAKAESEHHVPQIAPAMEW